jgi:hypothetical protein
MPSRKIFQTSATPSQHSLSIPALQKIFNLYGRDKKSNIINIERKYVLSLKRVKLEKAQDTDVEDPNHFAW